MYPQNPPAQMSNYVETRTANTCDVALNPCSQRAGMSPDRVDDALAEHALDVGTEDELQESDDTDEYEELLDAVACSYSEVSGHYINSTAL